MQEIKIGNTTIGGNSPAYIIAEIGLNHQGDLKLAKKLIDRAVEAGADAVKFQKRSLKHVYKQDVLQNVHREEHASHYLLDHIMRTELAESDMRSLQKYAIAKGVDFLCTPWDEKSLKFLATLRLPAYKIASADMFNLPFIGKVAQHGKPLLISTGMSFFSEIEQLVTFLKKINAQYILLHCNSSYPAPIHELNLRFLTTMQERFGGIVGYSGHESGIGATLAAVALGAKVIERHITLDRTLPGPDHRASLEPDEFVELVKQIRIIESSLGGPVRFPSRGEYLNRESLSKSIVAARNIPKGATLALADLTLRSPGKGTNPMKLNYFIGKKLIQRELKKHDYVLESDVNPLFRVAIKEKRERLKHKWGVVSRMGDIEEMVPCGSDFLEIRLTDSDVTSARSYQKQYPIDIVFHASEYMGDQLVDLSSRDPRIRKHSVEFLNASLKYARTLKPLFKNGAGDVKFIVHPGGMDMHRPLLEHIPELNKNLYASIKELDARNFEILVENMPGHPWYFGGQWYHASFMDAAEIAAWSRKTGYGITFDVSHAALYCNLYKKNLEEFTKTILPVTRYVHISDAARTNGEGLQIGDGTVDFKRILPYLVKTDLWLLPEIWQGHKFGGEGYLRAVKSLKRINPAF